jgi:1-acyl-sn-glycerol-3-phosphate acyltransferase
LLYTCLKIWVRLSATIFFSRIVINKPELLKVEGPLLIASNHPNSFLDAVLLDILFKKPVWSLARGDVFKKPFYIRLLHRLKILPVYRTREGVENLEHNYQTFSACKEIFRQKGLVLIFSEGLCVNEWHLRPLKKGTARLAISAWQEGIPLSVLPCGINYSSFKRIGKNVFLHFGEIITAGDINLNESDGRKNQVFNEKLKAALQQLVYEIPADDYALQKEKLSVTHPAFIKALLFIPALIGYLLNFPFYLPVKYIAANRIKEPGHFDSIMLALLTFFYPGYVLLLSVICYLLSGSWLSFGLLLVLPVTAWAYVRLKGRVG